MEEILVSELMQVGGPSVSLGTSLNRASQILVESKCRVLPVLNEGHNQVYGVLTDIRIMEEVSVEASALRWKCLSAEQVMDHEVIYCDPSTDILSVAKIFMKLQVPCFPVLSREQNQYLGMISWEPVFNYLVCGRTPGASQIKRSASF